MSLVSVVSISSFWGSSMAEYAVYFKHILFLITFTYTISNIIQIIKD